MSSTWTHDFDFQKEVLTEIPLWLKLPNLPLSCWGSNSLSRIGSVIGKPIMADECTTVQSRISYARLLVKVDVTKPKLDAVKVVEPNGRTFMQTIVFDWYPVFCKTCQKIGHDCTALPRTKKNIRGVKYKQVLTPKETAQPSVVEPVQHVPVVPVTETRDSWTTVVGRSAAKIGNALASSQAAPVSVNNVYDSLFSDPIVERSTSSTGGGSLLLGET